jgi:hypothetical protein
MTGNIADVARAAVAIARRGADLEKLSGPELVALLRQFEKIYDELVQELHRKERLVAQQSKGE